MNRIWIDALTPKQILFFSKLAELLKKDGFEVLMTTREFREIDGLLKKKKIEAMVIGKYGGSSLEDKLRMSIERMRELLNVIKNWKPDKAISFTSPEASRIAFGLGIPHYSVSDSPHSMYVSKLAIPLSKLLFTPWVIPKKVWVKFGIDKKCIIHYRGLDPIAWLRDFHPSPEIINEIGLDLHRYRIVIRETETYASYLKFLNKTLAPVSDSVLPSLIKELGDSAQFIIVPRYEKQIEYLRERFDYESVIVLDKVVDGASLLYYSTILIGGGGTMNTEAALLGKPVISMYPGKTTLVEDYLVRNKLVFRPSKVKEVINLVNDLINNQSKLNQISRRAKSLVNKLENPVEKISRYIKAEKE